MGFSTALIETLSIDCLIFGYKNRKLEILLVKHRDGISEGQWALPGGWIKYDEGLETAANRILKDTTGVSKVYLEQLGAFGNPDRYPGKRVVTVAFFALVKPQKYSLKAGFTASDAQWFPVQHLPVLPYDHPQIFNAGYQRLKNKVETEHIGFNLLPPKFTLNQLYEVYETILEKGFDKPNFRRKILGAKWLKSCHELEKAVPHRRAKLYRVDQKTYFKLNRVHPNVGLSDTEHLV